MSDKNIAPVGEYFRKRNEKGRGLEMTLNKIRSALGGGEALGSEDMKSVYGQWVEGWKPSSTDPTSFRNWGKTLGTESKSRFSKPWRPLTERDWQDFVEWYNSQQPLSQEDYLAGRTNTTVP